MKNNLRKTEQGKKFHLLTSLKCFFLNIFFVFQDLHKISSGEWSGIRTLGREQSDSLRQVGRDNSIQETWIRMHRHYSGQFYFFRHIIIFAKFLVGEGIFQK